MRHNYCHVIEQAQYLAAWPVGKTCLFTVHTYTVQFDIQYQCTRVDKNMAIGMKFADVIDVSKFQFGWPLVGISENAP
jgi:hypothetical protein